MTQPECDEDAVVAALTALIDQRLDFQGLHRVLQDRCLYAAEAERLAHANIDLLREQGRVGAAEFLAHRWSYVERSRATSVAEVFADLARSAIGGYGILLPPSLHPEMLDADAASDALFRHNAPDDGLTDAVIERYDAVLRHPDFATANGPARAVVLNNFVVALANGRPVTRLGELRRAHRLIVDAVASAGPEPGGRDRCQSTLGDVAYSLNEYEADPRLLTQAVSALEEAAEAAETGTPLRRARAGRLAGALRGAYEALGDVAYLQRAIAIQTALIEEHADPYGEANLAYSLRDRFHHFGVIDDLHRALAITSRLAENESLAEDTAAFVASTYGNCLESLRAIDHDPAVTDRMVAAYERAAEVPPETVPLPVYLRYQNNFAGGLSMRAVERGDGTAGADLDRAITLHERIRELTPVEMTEWPRFVNALAAELVLRYESRHDRADLDRAGELLAAVLAAAPPPLIEQVALNNSARTAQHRYELTGDDADLRDGTGFYRRASVSRNADDVTRLRTQHVWSVWAFGRSSWAEAAEAMDLMLDTVAGLLGRQSSRRHREQILQASQGLSSYAGYAWAREGDPRRAITAMERGQNLLARQTLHRPQQAEDTGEPEGPTSDGDAWFVYLAATDAGGVAIVTRPQRQDEPTVVWLPTVTDRRLNALISSYLEHSRADRQQFAHRLDGALGSIGADLWRPLRPALDGCRHVVLVPCGLLSAVPLHAAWWPDPAGRRVYALDERLVTYAPNREAYRRARTAANGDGDLLFVGDPQHRGSAPLQLSDREAQAATRWFPGATVLDGARASAAAVRAALPGHSVVHFSCHAYADLATPGTSALMLAGSDTLTVDELLAAKMDGTRLAILSACETGLPGFTLPDEAISIGSALQYAGCAGVVASLWSVYEGSTMLLMRRFYDLRHGGGLEPAEALRQSQLWLRDTADRDIVSAYPDLASGFTNPGPTRSRSGVLHWAAFTFTGA
ncbi:CHAT domain-containing protein [Dactylosporangium cerinum]|uniref:CHAT domain-containing protein n=1 Tax=Dactylosporangium cerinum TaxID=1434730 RepID=A0ABV9VL03_9ACTN